jgi:hypothetical protein
MLAFGLRKDQSRPAARRESAERRLGFGVDQRPRVKKFEFQDVLRFADDQAEREMMTPTPSPGWRRFFGQMRMAYARRLETAARMDPSFPSASGARLTLLL